LNIRSPGTDGDLPRNTYPDHQNDESNDSMKKILQFQKGEASPTNSNRKSAAPIPGLGFDCVSTGWPFAALLEGCGCFNWID